MNLLSSFCSAWHRHMSRPGNVLGAPGLSLMAWSQMHDRGKLCDTSSLKTLVNAEYCEGMAVAVSLGGPVFGVSASSCFWPKVNGVNSSFGSGSMMMRPM